MLSILIPNHNEDNIQELIAEIERVLPANQIIIAVDRDGKGKGWAMREALHYARGKYIAFLDGDGDIEPRMLKRLLPFLEDFDVVVGSKRMTYAPLQRKILTYLSRIYIRLMFGLPCDTQTGIKLFRSSALRTWETDGFLFDVEILAAAHRRELKIVEVPVEAEITKSMSRRAIWRTFLESLKIKFL
jgi:dolichol-phosphate mannosyltransferase